MVLTFNPGRQTDYEKETYMFSNLTLRFEPFPPAYHHLLLNSLCPCYFSVVAFFHTLFAMSTKFCLNWGISKTISTFKVMLFSVWFWPGIPVWIKSKCYKSKVTITILQQQGNNVLKIKHNLFERKKDQLVCTVVLCYSQLIVSSDNQTQPVLKFNTQPFLSVEPWQQVD